MGVLILVSVAVMLGMLYYGLYCIMEFDAEKRIIGIAVVTWVAMAIYLLVTKVLPNTRQEPYSIAAVTALSTAGAIVGRMLATAVRPEWAEELREIARRRLRN